MGGPAGVVGEVALLGGGVGAGGLSDPGVFESVAGGVALLLCREDGVGIGIAVGDESGDERPAVLLAELDAGNGELAGQKIFHGGAAGGLCGKSGEGMEPDDAEVVVGIVDHAVGGEGGAAGEEFGLGRVAQIMMDRSFRVGEE